MLAFGQLITDTHVPQFLLLTKTKEEATEGPAFREIFRTRSAAGKAHDKARKNKNNWAKRQATKEERAAIAEAKKAAPHSTPAASSWEPMTKSPEPKATTSKRGGKAMVPW